MLRSDHLYVPLFFEDTFPGRCNNKVISVAHEDPDWHVLFCEPMIGGWRKRCSIATSSFFPPSCEHAFGVSSNWQSVRSTKKKRSAADLLSNVWSSWAMGGVHASLRPVMSLEMNDGSSAKHWRPENSESLIRAACALYCWSLSDIMPTENECPVLPLISFRNEENPQGPTSNRGYIVIQEIRVCARTS